MTELVANCPRCNANNMTFDLLNQVTVGVRHGWQNILETFCICRNCNKPTLFVVAQKEIHFSWIAKGGLESYGGSANQVVNVERYVSIKDHAVEEPPEFLPENIESIFREGAACMAIGCNNAAATMFRLCLDLATQHLLPEEAEGLNNRIRRSLGLRISWLFDNNTLPESLRDLSSCIKDDGNDGAHEGTLSAEDTADILDFTFILLERLFTEPKRLEQAANRRIARRTKA
ncbi:DUF4145 domain-containing protein [Aliivibrio fischeri]|uniref:DUF4145 domain-containing protein n=1 Tax=Aliivibrio fischeri TaxID=668 RepID=UPI0012D9EA4C|nr:DUF4145 domain-containing protein [Aliivibrio fischeri]MUK79124.1 DUF4145 domain-containing protein [Aliivibrio fischeri]